MWRLVSRTRHFLTRHPLLYWVLVVALALAVGTSAPTPGSPAVVSATADVRDALPPGTRGVAVPLGTPPLPIRVGDRVDLVTVATDLEVLEIGETWALIAVPSDRVEAAAGRLSVGEAMIVISERRTRPSTAPLPPPDTPRTG